MIHIAIHWYTLIPWVISLIVVIQSSRNLSSWSQGPAEAGFIGAMFALTFGFGMLVLTWICYFATLYIFGGK